MACVLFALHQKGMAMGRLDSNSVELFNGSEGPNGSAANGSNAKDGARAAVGTPGTAGGEMVEAKVTLTLNPY